MFGKGKGVFASGRNSAWKPQKASEYPLCQRKTGNGLEISLANQYRGWKITKKAQAGRGQDTKWEISIQYYRPKEKTHVN
jgi:hypothetical protein